MVSIYLKNRLKSLTFIFCLLPFFLIGSGVNIFLNSPYDSGPKNPKQKNKIRIVVDAGHGGHDPGAVGKQSKEKDLTLAMALQLEKMIGKNHPEVEVLLTRENDVFIPLFRRIQFANEEKADLFISIHCNFISSPSTRGTETFVMGLHRAEENLAVAKRENASILLEHNYKENYDGYDPNSIEGHIMMSMFQNAYLEKSISFAALVENSFAKMKVSKSRGVKQAGFAVLRRASMPAVLVEAGFLSNEDEEAFLLSDEGQSKVCNAMLEAVTDFISQKQEENRTVVESKTAGTNADISENNAGKYRVQIAAMKTVKADMDSSELRKIGQLHVVEGKDINKYMVGDFMTMDEAQTAKEKLKKMGYTGAFLVVLP
ncbi:MAG: N-acetylmuramoyl-L-alanine amidase [Saprospiraceae bacterium]|nr:N-acetylmuramoyl-L-alanine amidase [Saprospiraceae bacterium]